MNKLYRHIRHDLARRHLHAASGSALLFLLAVMTVVPLAARAAAEIPTPQWMETTAVAEKMIVNGLDSQVQYFEAERSLEEVLSFYRQRWAGSYDCREGYREAEAGSWQVISRLEGRYLLTVQARPKNPFSTEGYLAIADLKKVQKNKVGDAAVPRMAGSKVINDQTSYDPGKKGRTVVLVNDYSVARNSGFYRDYYLDRGWGRLQDQEHGGAQVLAFRKFGRQAHLVIQQSSVGAVTVMNLVQAD